jgi:hypothetical protein
MVPRRVRADPRNRGATGRAESHSVHAPRPVGTASTTAALDVKGAVRNAPINREGFHAKNASDRKALPRSVAAVAANLGGLAR